MDRAQLVQWDLQRQWRLLRRVLLRRNGRAAIDTLSVGGSTAEERGSRADESRSALTR